MLWCHWTDLNQTWTHIHLWLLFKKSSELFRTLPPRSWGKNAFWDRLWTSTKHISATEYDINNRKETGQLTGAPLHAPKFGELCPRNGWERLASFRPPPKFSHWETLPALPHGRYTTGTRQTLAPVNMARAYSLEQQNARRTHAGLCHASSTFSSSYFFLFCYKPTSHVVSVVVVLGLYRLIYS